MKRKRLDRDAWPSIVPSRFSQQKISLPGFQGIASVSYMRETEAVATWPGPNGRIQISGPSFRWLQLLPQEEHYLLSANVDPQGRVTGIYIDMIDKWGFEEDGVVWFDDLYLDLLVFPDGSVVVEDRDELEEALATGDISPAQHRLALNTWKGLMAGILRDIPGLYRSCLDCLELLEALNNANQDVENGQ